MVPYHQITLGPCSVYSKGYIPDYLILSLAPINLRWHRGRGVNLQEYSFSSIALTYPEQKLFERINEVIPEGLNFNLRAYHLILTSCS